jgi:hypothetical protein
MKDHKVTIEEKIKEVYSYADELRVLLKLPKEHAQVSVEYYDRWHVKVRPSLMTFGGMFTHLMERGHSGKTLQEALNKAADGAKEELELYKKGLTLGV